MTWLPRHIYPRLLSSYNNIKITYLSERIHYHSTISHNVGRCYVTLYVSDFAQKAEYVIMQFFLVAIKHFVSVFQSINQYIHDDFEIIT